MKPPARIPPRTKLSVFGTPWPLDPPLLRIRLRYITARFLQMPEPRLSLRNTDEILRFAQQMMDDGTPRAATELVRLAIEEDAEQRPLWLLLLARAFEDDNAGEFAELAAAFATQFPNDAAQPEVAALAQWLGAPSHPTPDPARTAAWSPATLLGRDNRAQQDFHGRLQQVSQSPPLR
jgi:hypothetical protein